MQWSSAYQTIVCGAEGVQHPLSASGLPENIAGTVELFFRSHSALVACDSDHRKSVACPINDAAAYIVD